MYRETAKRGKRKSHYLVENIRSGSGWKKIKVYLGSNLTERELKNRIAEKRKILEERVKAYLKASDPLRSLITDREAKELESVRKKHQEYQKKAHPFEKKQYYEWFGVQFTYNTSAIEGATLSLLDTKLLLEDKIVPKGKSIREINEVQNHKEAFDYMLSYKGSLTRSFVLSLHKKLMHNILWKQAGKFRDVQVYLPGVDKKLPKPEEVPKEFKKLMLWHAHNKNRYHPVVAAAYYHAAFESIHPFRDGNGRVGRLILNFMLRKSGFPMIDIKYRDRRKYYEGLQAYDRGNLRPLAEMIIKYIK